MEAALRLPFSEFADRRELHALRGHQRPPCLRRRRWLAWKQSIDLALRRYNPIRTISGNATPAFDGRYKPSGVISLSLTHRF